MDDIIIINFQTWHKFIIPENTFYRLAIKEQEKKFSAILHLLREGRGEKFGFLENSCYSYSELKCFSLIIEDGKTKV